MENPTKGMALLIVPIGIALLLLWPLQFIPNEKLFWTHEAKEKKKNDKFREVLPSDVHFSHNFFLEFAREIDYSQFDFKERKLDFFNVDHSEIILGTYDFNSYVKEPKEILEEIILLVNRKAHGGNAYNRVWYYKKKPGILSCVVVSYSSIPGVSFIINHYNIVNNGDWSEYRYGSTFY